MVPGTLSPSRPWTSRDVTAVREVPDRLLIVGGGVVAVEAATWMAALGSTVTMLVRGDSLLTGYEPFAGQRSEEHTSELQSRGHLVCRLLLEKKKDTITHTAHSPL